MKLFERWEVRPITVSNAAIVMTFSKEQLLHFAEYLTQTIQNLPDGKNFEMHFELMDFYKIFRPRMRDEV